jgi:geranylgeranyl pyrophosphate synthase
LSSKFALKDQSGTSDLRYPSPSQLARSLLLRFGGKVETELDASLLVLVRDILDRPSKRFRARAVEIGAQFGTENSDRVADWIKRCAEVIEILHTGSLVIDDIEDQSTMRRGAPCLHQTYGAELAINAGNWMYFWPLAMIGEGGFGPERELLIYRAYHRMVLEAHAGQALDTGVVIDQVEQSRVRDVCLASMELKSGAPMALALVLGAIVSGAPEGHIEALEAFGHGLGVGLQMFDDLGNFTGKKDPGKRYEELRNRRPSWVWVKAAELGDAAAYADFKCAVRSLPDDQALQAWAAKFGLLEAARAEALQHLERINRRLEMELGPDSRRLSSALEEVRGLSQQIAVGYG